METSHLADNARLDKTCGTLAQGLARSQNAMIAKLAHRHLSQDILADTARDFGFDRAPEFALDVEANRFRLPEKPLEFARVSAGFWSTELSPLGGALVANVIATRGKSVTPQIVSEIRGNGAVVPVVAVDPVRVIDEKVAERVAEMMRATVTEGTARKAFKDPAGRRFMNGTTVAGKTGSLTRATPSYLSYSWFVGFAPVNEPEVSVAVLLGNPEKWHLKAHTAARLVLDERF